MIQRNKIKSSPFYQSIKINLISMLCTIILTEPFWSITDYNEVERIYGLYTGEYSYQTKFINFIYSKILFQLIQFCDQIPWYTVMFFFVSFSSMAVIIYFFLKVLDNRKFNFLAWVICFFFSYELYHCINFTKIASALGAASILLLIKKKSIFTDIIGVVGILMGIVAMLIRYDIGKMIIAIYFFALLFCFLYDVYKRTIDVKWYVKKIVAIMCVLGFMILIPYIKYSSEAESAFWHDIFVWNDYRSTVQDYELPDYDTNAELYEEIGVSKTDIYIWKGWNDDCYKLNNEVGEKLYLVQKRSDNIIEKCFDIKNIYSYFKLYPLSFFTIDMFFIFVILFIYYLVAKKKNVINLILVYLCGVLLVVNYYLFINGRYLQHRVDVGIIMALFAVLVLLMEYTGVKFLTDIKYDILINLTLFILLLVVPFGYYGDDIAYISDKQIEENKRFFEYTKDQPNLYLIGNSRDLRAINEMCYKPFEVPESDLKHNIIMGANPENSEMRQKNGINNPYTDIVDNENFYLVLLDDSDENIVYWEQYISDSSQKQVKIVFEKEVENKNLYRVKTKE